MTPSILRLVFSIFIFPQEPSSYNFWWQKSRKCQRQKHIPWFSNLSKLAAQKSENLSPKNIPDMDPPSDLDADLWHIVRSIHILPTNLINTRKDSLKLPKHNTTQCTVWYMTQFSCYLHSGSLSNLFLATITNIGQSFIVVILGLCCNWCPFQNPSKRKH